MAGRIPKAFIDELLARTDIVDVIDARVPLKRAGKDHKACCPFHEEKTPSFTVSVDKQFYHCFGCGAHGSAINFLMEYDHMSFPEAVKELAARAGLPIPQEAYTADTEHDRSDALLEVLRDAARYYRQQLREHPQAGRVAEYLKGRGITGEIANEFGIGFAPDGWDNLLRALAKDNAQSETLVQAGLVIKKETGGYYDRFRNRVMFPIEDHRGRIVAFGGRVIDQGEPKYLNSPETPLFHKGRELYGLHHARAAIKRENRVLVVEGYMDVVALAQFGVDFAVATLGTAATRDHLERLYRHTTEVVFCFDGDRAGRQAAWRALDVVLALLHEGRQASFLFLPEGDDPDSLVRKEGKEAFLKRIQQATAVPEFLFKELASQVDVARLDGRARLAELAKPYVEKVPSGVLRAAMLERLKLSPVELHKLTELVTRRPPGQAARSSRASASTRKEPPSIVRLAIAMVLQHPELVQQVRDAATFADMDLPGIPLFLALLDLLKTSPDLNTAAILEGFRDTEHEPAMAKLAVWQHPALDQTDIQAEFLGVMQRLLAMHGKIKTERLLQKQRFEGLTADEKTELAQILAGKSQLAAQKREH